MHALAFQVISAIATLVLAAAASAQSGPAAAPASTPARTEAAAACPVGTHWVPGSYVHGGKWRDAHCAEDGVSR